MAEDKSSGLAAGAALAMEQLAIMKHTKAAAKDLMDKGPQQASLPLLETGQDVDGMATVIDIETGHKGPGRPLGSKNKKSEEWAEYLLSQYRSPLVAMAEIYGRETAVLALELHCSLLEAFKLQLDAMKTLATYVHQRLPQLVTFGDDETLIPLEIVCSKAYAAANQITAIETDEVELLEIPD